jgi:hypothetical protein
MKRIQMSPAKTPNPRKAGKVSLALTLLLLLVSVALAQGDQDDYDLSWWTVDSGGDTSTGTDNTHNVTYTLSGTAGQPDAGGLSGGPYMLVGGFWAAVIEEPTAIDLLSFTAEPFADHVTLTWQTGTEVDNAGFNLHRATAADGPYTKLNDALIPAEGDPESGASYTYTDTDVVKGVTYYYKLEDVDIHGASTFHGPVSATPGRIRWIYLPLVFD